MRYSRLARACLLLIVARTGVSGSTPTPPLPRVGVMPLVIVPQPLKGATIRADQEALQRRLVEEATARAERSLLRQNIAATVERLPSRARPAEPTGRSSTSAPVSDSHAAEVYLAGVVRLPLSLPPSLARDWTWFRRGRFAYAEVQLLRADGSMIARAEATLDWSDIRWFSGAGRLHYARPLDDVLVDFTRNATDRAVKHLRGPVRASLDHDKPP